LNRFDAAELVLPEIQRDFVWGKNNVLLLFDSLYRGLPIGSMLVWKAKTVVPTRKSLMDLKIIDSFYGYLLDGQQRLTSIQRVRDNDENYPLLFSLLPTNTRDKDRDRFQYRSSKNKKNPWYIPVSEVLSEKFISYNALTQLKSKTEVSEAHLKDVSLSLSKLQNVLNYDVGVIEFDEDDYSTATELFIRFNSTGKSLNRNDLISAELAIKVENLVARKIKPFATKYKNFKFTIPFLMQCLTAVHTGKMKFKRPEEIWDGSDKIKIYNSWKNTAKGLGRLIKFLTGAVKWNSDQWIPSMNALIPLVFILSNHNFTNKEQKLARKWLLLTAVHAYFSGSVHSTLDTLLRKLSKVNGSKLNKLWNITKKELPKLTADNFETKRQTGAVMSLYISMLRNSNAKDWDSSKNPLDGNVQGHNASLEIHHIFPKDILLKNGYGYNQINTFANYAIISKDANLSISNEMPKTYLKRNNNKIVIKKKDRKVQCIPEDIKIWQIKKYKRFLVERRQLLAKRINEYLG
jgi:hypothetical protein